MTQTKKTPRRTAKKTTAKKTTAKKAPVSHKLPDVQKKDEKKVLPRGQEQLPDGTIRLKTGDHELSKTPQEFDVHGIRLTLSGKVMIAGQNVNWLAITKCQKCNTPRSKPVEIKKVDNRVVITYWCNNAKECPLGGRLYVAVYDGDKISIN